jgi:hypothetical protein
MPNNLSLFDIPNDKKVVRTKALRAGFKDCWQRKDYTSVVTVTRRLPETGIEEDPALLMYFDNASLLKAQ